MLVSRAALRACGPADDAGRAAACRARLASMLVDWPGAALSLGALIGDGAKRAGEWFGPHEAATLVEQHARSIDLGALSAGCARHGHMVTVVCAGGIVDCARVAAAAGAPQWRNAVLALVPLRLGLGHRLERDYRQLLRDALEQPACVGAVAGPRGSAMFVCAVTAQGRLEYLDPHDVRDSPPAPPGPVAAGAATPPEWFVDSLSPPAMLPSLPCELLDPSLCLGFLFLSAKELHDFRQHEAGAAAAGGARLFSFDHVADVVEDAAAQSSGSPVSVRTSDSSSSSSTGGASDATSSCSDNEYSYDLPWPRTPLPRACSLTPVFPLLPPPHHHRLVPLPPTPPPRQFSSLRRQPQSAQLPPSPAPEGWEHMRATSASPRQAPEHRRDATWHDRLPRSVLQPARRLASALRLGALDALQSVQGLGLAGVLTSARLLAPTVASALAGGAAGAAASVDSEWDVVS